MFISIDLWGTLIKCSPLFVEAKLELTKKYFKLSDEKILKAYSDTKIQFNAIIEHTGAQPSQDLIFGLLFVKLNGKYQIFYFHKEFIKQYQKLSIEFSPLVFSQQTKEYLSKLSDLGSMCLSSNTMFISGKSLRKTLDKLDIYDFFDKFYFSDERGYSKPDKRLYGKSHFHIGDNNLTDNLGAMLAGSQPIIINSNNLTIKDAYNIIAQSK